MGSNELTGRVENFDHSAKTLTISGQSVKVDSSTEVMKDGQTASLTDISEGDQVRASFSGSGDAMTAQRIEVMSAGTDTSGMGTSGTGTSPGTHDPAGRGGAMGPGTGTGQSDSAGTTSGTGTGSTSGSDTSSSGSPSGTGR
jgi:hypothetical protein